jgi:hypothetical protein
MSRSLVRRGNYGVRSYGRAAQTLTRLALAGGRSLMRLRSGRELNRYKAREIKRKKSTPKRSNKGFKRKRDVSGECFAGDSSKFNWLHKRRRKLAPWMLVAKNLKSYESVGTMSCFAGRQTPVELAIVYGQTSISDQLGDQTTTAATIGSARVMMYECNLVSMFTNNSTASVILELYDVLVKKPTNGSTVNSWKNGLTGNQMGDGIAPLSGGSGNAGQWGTKPYTSMVFRQHFRVRKVTRKIMAPGQTHRHVVKIAPNRMLNDTTESAQWDNFQYLSNLSYCLMGVVSGGQVDRSSDEITISTASGQIDYVIQQTYRYNGFAGQGDTYRSLTTAFSSALTGEKNINEETGLPAAIVNL